MRSVKLSHVLFLSLAMGLGGFWCLGRTQPVAVVQSVQRSTENRVCKTCGGFGTIQKSAKCPDCGGTGKGEWRFKNRTRKRLSDTKPMCMKCRGSGVRLVNVKCPDCAGRGRKDVTTSARVRTVRAELSPWEKFLKCMWIKPDINCKPQVEKDSSVPLVEKYIEVCARDATGVRFVEWFAPEQVGAQWHVRAVFECTNPEGDVKTFAREFHIKNREVVSSKPFEWNG